MMLLTLLTTGLVAQAAQSSDRPVTFGDIRDLREFLVEEIAKVTRQVADLVNVVTLIRIEDARDRERITQQGEHIMAMQTKLNYAGIDGTRRMVDEDWCEAQHRKNGITPQMAKAEDTKPQLLIGLIALGSIAVQVGKAAYGAVLWIIANASRLKP